MHLFFKLHLFISPAGAMRVLRTRGRIGNGFVSGTAV